MRKTVLFIVLLISNFLSAQELPKLYKNNFPAEYYTNISNEQFLNSNLEKLTSTRPDLVYYLSHVLNSYSETKDTAAFLKGMRYITNLVRQIEYKHKRWIENELKSASKLAIEPSLRQKVMALYPGVAADTSGDVPFMQCPFPVNENKKYYFSFIYFSNDSLTRYNDAVDYKEKLYREEKSLIDGFKNISANSEDENKENTEFIKTNNILKFWYLFADNDFSNRENIRVYRIFADMISDEYAYNVGFNKFELHAGYSLNGTDKIKYLIDRNPVYKPVEYNNSFETQQFSIGLSYRLQIKPVRSSFSYINTSVSYQALVSSKSKVQNINATYLYSVISGKVKSDYMDEVTSPGANIYLNKLSTIFVESSVPVFFPIRNFALEIGIAGGLNIIDYSYNYSFHYTHSSVKTLKDNTKSYEVLEEGDVSHNTVNGSRTQLVLRPIVKLVFDFVPGISVVAEGSSEYGVVFIAYSF